MGNQFITSKLIARESLPILMENLVFPNLVYQDYKNEYKKLGDTIQIKKPIDPRVDEFNGTVQYQDYIEDSIYVKLDKIADSSFSFSVNEYANNVDDLRKNVIEPTIIKIAEKINADGLALYKDIPYYVGTPGTTPDGLDDFANARKDLSIRKVPLSMRNAVWSPDAEAKFSILDAIVNAEKSGSTQALREGSIGRVGGFDNYMAQAVKTHIAGGYTALADVTATVDIANNTKDLITNRSYSVAALTSAAGAATTKLLKGDLLLIDGKRYTVLADTADAVAGVISSVKIYPALSANITAKAVTFVDATAAAHVANLAFHKTAFAFVQRPLEPATGFDSYVTNFNGVSLRVTMGYDMDTKTTKLSIDTLYGFTTLYPELATRVLG